MKPARIALVGVMCALLGVAIMRAADTAPAVMAAAANRLLGSLTPEQKAKATARMNAAAWTRALPRPARPAVFPPC
jgi:hypothetical protein